MKILTRLLILGFLPLFWFSCKTTQPVTLQRNQQAVEEIERGKQLLRSKDYLNAARTFQQASIRPFNQHTTVAIYLTGLAFYYQQDYNVASQNFQTIIQEFPRSRYVEEAKYHEALIKLTYNTSIQRRNGLEELLKLSREAKDKRIAQDARQYVQEYLFNQAEDNWVNNYYLQASEENKQLALEALCFRKVKNGEKEVARQTYNQFLEKGGKSTAYLEELFKDQTPKIDRIEKDIIRVALCLPLRLEDNRMRYSGNIPGEIKIILEFYEGFSLAVENFEQRSNKKVYVELFDTQNDTAKVRELLPLLDRLYPDVVIGGIYTPPSRILSEWTQKRGIPQIVPFSRSMDVSQNEHLFLTNPYFEVHGARMGDFAKDVLGLKKVAVWSDGTIDSETFANGFIQAFDTLDTNIEHNPFNPNDSSQMRRIAVKMEVDSIYDRGKDRIAAKDEIPRMVREMQNRGFDGVYIPIRQQTISGLILGQLNNYDLKVKVMGSHYWWQNFNSIDRELKERYRLLFTASSMYQGDESGYNDFYQSYLKNYKYPPGNFSIDGYDLGMYILPLLDQFSYDDPIPLTRYLKLKQAIQGIHGSYYFGGNQINQSVNIGEFTNDGVLKVSKEMMEDKEYWWKIIEEEEEEEGNR